MATKSPNEAQKPQVSTAERARLRRNQRNSRARKQAYLEDLERRWTDCVAQGAQASTELQQEARRVQAENGQLRLMLHELGVDHATIQQRLATGTTKASTTISTPSMSVQSSTMPEMSPATLPEAVQNHQQAQAFAPWQPMNNDAFGMHNDNWVTADLDSSNATMHEWDLYHWLQDLTALKDAFGSENPSFVEPLDSIDLSNMPGAMSNGLASPNENSTINHFYTHQQDPATQYLPS